MTPSQTPPPTAKPWWVGRLTRRLQVVLDLGALALAFAVAYLLRFDFEIPADHLRRGLVQLPIVVLVQFVVLVIAGVHKFVWRYVGMAEIRPFIVSAVFSCAPMLALRLGLPKEWQVWRIPISIILIDSVFGFGTVLALRIARRALFERYERQKTTPLARGTKPVLLIGAGRAGVMAAKEIVGRHDMDLSVVGFVDDDSDKHGAVIAGIKVLGTTDDLPKLVAEQKVDHVVITIAEAGRQELRRIVDICESIPIKVRIIPGLFEILQGRVSVTRIRDVQIEDLLGREQVKLDEAEIGGFLTGKCVMVTGAGGSIGAELARQVGRFHPSRLVLVERAEFALFDIDRELRARLPGVDVHAVVADIGDRSRVETILHEHCPKVIVHAAAHKHVPLMELNPGEAIKNNVLATKTLGELAARAGAEVFVLISSDKAVRPASVMGASKRVAELVVQDLNRRHPETRFLAVRFGNVMGSAGSVIPIFREQIARGGPVTVTHPDMERYFMTIPEAAQLVLQAGAMGQGGEIMVLDMGEPVRILQLARDMIALSGLRPEEDVEIVFTGLRPGEKLSEELQTSGEHLTKTRHPKIYIGDIEAYPSRAVEQALRRLTELTGNGGAWQLRGYLNKLLPEAQLAEANRSVDVSSTTPTTRV